MFRAKHYYKLEEKQLKNYLIPIHYKLSRETLENIGQEPMENAIAQTIYQEIGAEDELEDRIKKYLCRLYKNYFRSKAFDITMVIAYIELRRIQIQNTIVIIEGIRYELNYQQIQKKLIQN